MSWPFTCTERLAPWYAGALVLLCAPAAVAQDWDWERLIMPGEVIQGHAEIERECSSCHLPFRRRQQRDLCLACHDHADIAQDMESSQGFHGRSDAREEECSSCHTEHAGREMDIVGLDPETFDHELTDYALRGLHQSLACAGCHEPGDRHRDAPSRCFDCHAEQDAHEGSLGEDCARCHDESGWRAAEFDHDETDFPLIGEHRDVACGACHSGRRYEGTPTDCASCHQLRDVHGGRFGTACESCHTSHDWKRIAFDHDTDTDFPLRGSHQPLACDSCHTSGPYRVELEQSCYSCHQADDEHKGRFGPRCEDCHGEISWRDEKFDHERTDFPLRGAHADVSCVTCHSGVIGEAPLESTCQSCHREDDVHSGQQGEDCGLCHRESGWTHKVFFDHGLTRFPLLGLHAAATCEDCHSTSRFQDASLRCADCHGGDDFHERALGPDCAACHNPNGWTFWRFDHDSQTQFRLDGAHAGLRCHQCHVEPVVDRIHMSMDCATCHAGDDVHLGGYGPNCARCHSTTGWDRMRNMR